MCDHCGCRSLPQIAELTEEHDRILTLAWSVATGEGENVAPARAELVALLDRHAAKEERALYPLLSETGDLQGDSRADLEDEHREIRRLLIDGNFDRSAYYQLAAHAEAEESELFPMAMFGFDAQDWEEMSRVQRAVDTEAGL